MSRSISNNNTQNALNRKTNGDSFFSRLQANIFFRLFCSLALAVVVWMTINSTYVNPPAENYFTPPLTLLNRSSLENYNLELRTETFPVYVRIDVKGRKEDVDKLKPGDFEAFIDFGNVTDVDTTSLEVELRSSNTDNVTIVKIEPAEISFEVESRRAVTFDINVQFLGELEEGFYLTGYSRFPAMRSFLVRESLVSQIERVEVEVDLTGISGNTVFHQQSRVYNSDGVQMNRQGWEQVVEISLEVSKEVPIIPNVTGSPGEDHYVRYITVMPEVVRINGTKEALEQVDSLYTDALDINFSRQSISQTCALLLPNNVKMSLDALPRAAIDVTIYGYQYTQDFALSKSRIEIINNQEQFRYEIVESEIPLTLKGKVDDIANLDSNQISAVVDVGELTQGTNAALAIVTLPEGIVSVNDVLLTVIVANS